MSRKSKNPSNGYSRPKSDVITSLVISVVGESGESLGVFDFSDIDAPKTIMVDLVQAFQVATSSSGRWRSKYTVEAAATMLRSFARDIAKDCTGLKRMADFSAEMWWSWRDVKKSRTRWPGQINLTRCLLYEVETIPNTTRRALSIREKKPKTRLFEAYTKAEYRRIYAAAWKVVRKARRRIRINLLALQEYQSGEEPSDAPSIRIKKETWTRGRLIEYIYTNGTLPNGYIPNYWASKCREMLSLDKGSPVIICVYASTAEVYAAITLLICERGYNLSVASQLTAKPHMSDNGKNGATVQMLDKPRRGSNARYFSSTLSGKSGRIWEAIVEITQPARDQLALIGKPTDSLLIGKVTSGRALGGAFKLEWSHSSYLTESLYNLTGISLDNGQPLIVDFRRLRLTEQIINKRSNQNSDRVSETIYRRPDKQTKEVARAVILQGQLDAMSDAKAIMEVRTISSKEAVRAEVNPKELAKRLNVSVSRVRQLLNGLNDTATTACIDITQSPFSPSGEICVASFLKCFSCRNAVATPKHLPRLLTLHDAISELRSAVSDAVWNADYRTSYLQLSILLQSYSTKEEQAAARSRISEQDRIDIHNLLERRFDA